MTLAGSCCAAAATATTSSTIPYRRLKRFRERQAAAEAAAAAGCDGSITDSASDKRGIGRNDDLEDQRIRIRSIDRSPGAGDDTVVLKVATVGDSESGKSCFLVNYVSSRTHQGDRELDVDPESQHREENYEQTVGVVLREKCLRIKNAKIVFSIWELGGDKLFEDMLPGVCEGAAAVIFMFDLTKRSTLKSVKEWFIKTRKINNCAIPVLVGSKYDQFIDFPQDIQLAITKQAMFYAETMGASLFFSSTTHNINIHKIFKIIVAKVFDLRCNISRNYKLGEPIVVY